jgi:HemY protein
LAFALEDWKQAERLLLKSAPHSECALPYYLAAAQAADARGHSQARDQYLQWAFECDASWEFPLRLIQAKLQLKRGELEACADNLFALSLQNPRHADVLRLRGEWQQLKLAHDVTA